MPPPSPDDMAAIRRILDEVPPLAARYADLCNEAMSQGVVRPEEQHSYAMERLGVTRVSRHAVVNSSALAEEEEHAQACSLARKLLPLFIVTNELGICARDSNRKPQFTEFGHFWRALVMQAKRKGLWLTSDIHAYALERIGKALDL